ncbi:hypothetical protein BH09MYX1_BH09MYX1_05140 [soil metagenome]
MRLWRSSPGKSENGRALAAIPVVVAVIFGWLLVPRAVPPRDMPMPLVDAAAIERTHESDRARVRSAHDAPLPPEVRALGASIRAFNSAESAARPDTPWDVLRANVDRTRKEALSFGVGPLLDLRAVQCDRFVTELASWESGAPLSAELVATGGRFLQRFSDVGGGKSPEDPRARFVAPNEDERRVLCKLQWNTVSGFDGVSDFELTLDESRVLYTFYLGHPHPPEITRRTIDAARMTAKTAADCDALGAGEAMASEQWRVEKLKALGRIDATYPTDYAVGVAEYRAGRFEASARAFEAFIDKHPDGVLTLRARNHLRAALAEAP